MTLRQTILAPRLSSHPRVGRTAVDLLGWLAASGVVRAEASPCLPSRGRRGHAPGPRLTEMLRLAPGMDDPRDYADGGLEIVTERCIFTPLDGFEGRARCPACRREIGEALFEHLEVWMPAESDNFACPECDHEDDINGFDFSQPCAFSDLGFIFNHWPARAFAPAFLEEFRRRLGQPLAVVEV